jgi:hypothetical protein
MHHQRFYFEGPDNRHNTKALAILSRSLWLWIDNLSFTCIADIQSGLVKHFRCCFIAPILPMFERGEPGFIRTAMTITFLCRAVPGHNSFLFI